LGFGALVSHPARTALMRGFAAGMTFKDITCTFFLAPLYPVPKVRSIEDYRARVSAQRRRGEAVTPPPCVATTA
jgi:hypothetical protein